MALKSRWRANGLALVGSLLLSLLAAELLLRLLRLGYNHAPLNPSASRHHEHPANFNFKAYSLQNEWGEFPIRTDRFGNRSLQGLCSCCRHLGGFVRVESMRHHFTCQSFYIRRAHTNLSIGNDGLEKGMHGTTVQSPIR